MPVLPDTGNSEIWSRAQELENRVRQYRILLDEAVDTIRTHNLKVMSVNLGKYMASIQAEYELAQKKRAALAKLTEEDKKVLNLIK